MQHLGESCFQEILLPDCSTTYVFELGVTSGPIRKQLLQRLDISATMPISAAMTISATLQVWRLTSLATRTISAIMTISATMTTAVIDSR